MTSAALPPPSPAGASECLALTRTLRRRGTVVLSVFALVWAFAGASGTGPADGAVPLATEAVAVLLTVAALFLGLRKGAAPSPRTVNLPANWARGVGIINGLEVLAIFAVIAAANASGRPGLVPVGIALVVGLHFFPLARLFDQRQYTWTAVSLSAVALVGLAVLAAGTSAETIRAVVGLGAAVVLWASSFHVALKG